MWLGVLHLIDLHVSDRIRFYRRSKISTLKYFGGFFLFFPPQRNIWFVHSSSTVYVKHNQPINYTLYHTKYYRIPYKKTTNFRHIEHLFLKLPGEFNVGLQNYTLLAENGLLSPVMFCFAAFSLVTHEQHWFELCSCSVISSRLNPALHLKTNDCWLTVVVVLNAP